MNDSSYEQLLERLDGNGASAGVVDVVLAAAQGPQALDALLAGSPAPQPRNREHVRATTDSARVYLEQIFVQNFRGIGPPARLPLLPGPGLTLVVGRNGSGKSSFAEGLELLLTGTNLRWEDKTKVWRQGWRNLHGDGATVLAARFRVDGEQQPLEVKQQWLAGSTLEDADDIKVSGPRNSWDELGWGASLEQYRPLLSYNELGTMFSERAAALYEALSAVLGLQEFDDLAALLRDARLGREKTGKVEKTERKQLQQTLETSDDARATAIALQLGKRSPDVEAIETIVAGDDEQPSDAALRGLATLQLPDADRTEQALASFSAAIAEVTQLETTDADRVDALARLLTDAVVFHQRHGDGQTCPLCGTDGVLDESWSLRTQAEVEELRRRSSHLRDARAAAKAARSDLDALFPASMPACLRSAATEGVRTDDALAAWDRWAQILRGDDETVTAKGAGAAKELVLTAHAAKKAAAAEAVRRDSAWRPLRTAVQRWIALARQAARDAHAVATLKSAEGWMKECTADLRRERLKPIVEAAQRNWAELRHESNVALGEVELRKEGNRRYASFDVTVDGSASSAFGVMSQGELSALAVSIFLPRASLPESPFAFMVIDDPVQSMDPAKIDGLARVLHRAAEQRQVIVFTHDERLPEAIRRLDIDARIIQIKRRAQSKVEVVASDPPSGRYIGEALAFAKTEDVADEVRARVIPNLCRSAIEAACAARIRKRLINAGTPHADVEQELASKTTLNTWLAGALGLSTAQGNELQERVRKLAGDDAAAAVRTVTKGSHKLVPADGEQLAKSTRALVKALDPV